MEYDTFVKERGHIFIGEEKQKAAYERLLKARNGELLTEEEFAEECQCDYYKAAYVELIELVKRCQLSAGKVYYYAKFGWCIKHPEAIVAHRCDANRYEVNSCDTDISEAEATLKINDEWGFEASRVEIVGTAYYDASDWNFIRFDCAQMSWLMRDGALLQVFD